MTCWAPVPEAATSPTGPRRTTLANPRATPSTTAVPQSGPMTSRSARAATSLSRTSSSTGTLSEKSITEMPCSSASRASMVAYWPGTDTSARVAPPRAAAAPTVRGAGASPNPDICEPADFRAPRACSRAASPAATPSSSSARMATTSSLGGTASGMAKPMPAMTSRLSSVAIATWAALTPAALATCRETCIRLTES